MLNTEPKDIQLIVLTACFNEHQEMLLLQRKQDAHCAGFWSLPGGKVEGEELPLQAAVRELREETGLQGKRWRHLGKTSHVYDECSLHFIIFVCQCHDTTPFQAESEYAWVRRDDLEAYPMPEANQKIMVMLQMDELDEYLKEKS
ncbi:MAG: NUDIX domain-containing protein [Mariprofundaceae bacterium]|nr:NUDIX domain-containing protein [Mariprofundaceae bacterium]